LNDPKKYFAAKPIAMNKYSKEVIEQSQVEHCQIPLFFLLESQKVLAKE
jgi:hypothetical protein